MTAPAWCRVLRVSKRSLLHFAGALLLLIAQQGALTHSIWHLGRQATAEHVAVDGEFHSSDRPDRAPQSKLCDLHFALGSLLAGDCPGQSVLEEAPVSHRLVAVSAVWRVAQPLLTPPSRASPVLL